MAMVGSVEQLGQAWPEVMRATGPRKTLAKGAKDGLAWSCLSPRSSKTLRIR